VITVHWLSLVQPWHACVAVSQNGVDPPQSPLVRQPMQMPIAISQSGVVLAH
jgi:hypothetical protein